MADTKPLIFVKPYSESVEKLKEVVEEIAENEHINIVEVDGLEEYRQELVKHGPSLSIFAQPKKCAMGLQSNKKIVKRLQSKAVLISPKNLPRKIMDKFMKVGLNDCIVEPIAPKSLLYKIKLLLKSLPVIRNDDDDYHTFSSDGEQEEQDDLTLKEKKAREKAEQEKEQAEGEEDELVPAEEEKKASQQNEAEFIDNKYRGKLQENLDLEEEEDEDGKKEKDDHNHIEKHYKGKQVGEGLELEDDVEPDKKPDAVSEDELEDIKDSIALEVEDDSLNNYQGAEKSEDEKNIENQRKKAALELEEEDELSQKELMREQIEQEAKDMGSVQLEVEDDKEDNDFEDERDDQDLGGHYKSKETKKLDVEEDEPEITMQKEEAPKKESKRKDSDEGLFLEDDNEQEETQEGEEENIEKYYKNKELKPQLDLEEDNDFVDKKELKANESEDDDDIFAKPQLKVEEDQEDGENYLEEAKKEKKKKAQEQASLDIEDDFEPKQKQSSESDEFSDLSSKKDLKPKLDVEDENDMYEREKPVQQEDEREKKDLTKLDVDDDENGLKTRAEKDEDGNMKTKKPGAALQLEEEKNKKKKGPTKKVDHIDTYYGRAKKKVEDPDWDGLVDDDNDEEIAINTKEKYNKELIIDQEDLGEQTIDYGKLKEQFEALGGDYADKLKTRYEISEEVEEGKTEYTRTKVDPPQPIEGGLPEAPVATEEEEEEEEKRVIEPDSKGLEHAIKVLYKFENKNPEAEDIYKYVTKTLNDELKGVTSFFILDTKTELFEEEFCGHLIFPSMMGNEEDGSQDLEPKEIWQKYKLQNLEKWREAKLPTWSDETFQETSIQFIYPYFEGIKSMGFAVVDFDTGITEDKTAKVEVLLECARSFYLQNYHATGKVGKYKKLKKETVKKEKKGLFGGLFKKKAA